MSKLQLNESTVLENEDEYEIIQEIMRDFEHSKSYRSEFDGQWMKYHNYYEGLASVTKLKTWMADIFVPKTFTAVESIVCQLIIPLMNNKEPIVTVTPRNPDFMDNAKKIQTLLKYQFDSDRVLRKLITVYKQAIMFGTCICRFEWKTRMVERMIPDMMGNSQLTTIPEGYPSITPINLFDFYSDPSAIEIKDCKYVIHRQIMSYNYLKKLEEEGIYNNLDDLEETLKSTRNNNSDQPGFYEPPFKDSSQGITVLIYYTNRYITHILPDYKKIIRMDKNVYGRIPFIKGKYCEAPFKFYGIGAIQPITKLQEELNLTRAQRRDNLTLSILKMFAWKSNSFVNSNEMETAGPGFSFEMRENPRDALYVIDFQDTTGANYREEQTIKADIDDTSGATEFIRGSASTGGGVTATEAQMKEQKGSSRFDLSFKLMGMDILCEIARTFIELSRSFGVKTIVPQEQFMENTNYIHISPDNLAGDFDFDINIDPQRLFGAAEREMAINIFNLLCAHPFVNQEKLVLFLLKTCQIPTAETFLDPQQGERAKIIVQLQQELQIAQLMLQLQQTQGQMQMLQQPQMMNQPQQLQSPFQIPMSPQIGGQYA